MFWRVLLVLAVAFAVGLGVQVVGWFDVPLLPGRVTVDVPGEPSPSALDLLSEALGQPAPRTADAGMPG